MLTIFQIGKYDTKTSIKPSSELIPDEKNVYKILYQTKIMPYEDFISHHEAFLGPRGQRLERQGAKITAPSAHHNEPKIIASPSINMNEHIFLSNF